MKRAILAAVFLLTVAIAGVAYESAPARVTDISDRAYEGAVIKLLDGAKKSIIVSMYSVSLGTQGNNPMRLLPTSERPKSGDSPYFLSRICHVILKGDKY